MPSVRRWWFSPLLMVAIGVSCTSPFFSGFLPADELRESTSLKYVPADASFYGACLRNREQFETFVASDAYTKLRNLPLVNFGLSMWEGQWQSPTHDTLRTVKELWEKDENQKLVRVVLDAVSQEVFMYGDANCADAMRLAQEFQRVARATQIRAAREGDSDKNTEEAVLKAFLEKMAKVKTPSTIIGFRLSDAQAAESQIARLEERLKELFAQKDELQPLRERLTREPLGGSSFLTLSLDGTLIPWDQLPEDSPLKDDEEVQAVLSKLKLTVSLGIKDGYLLLAMGESNAHIQKMGEGKLLFDRPELAVVRTHADQRIVNVGYASRDLLEQANSSAGQIDDLVTTAESLLPLAGLEEEVTEGLLKDLRQFATELKKFLPKPGAMVGVSFATDRGYEGFTYDWGENKMLDGSRKLDILDHVGSDPVAFVAARSQYAPEDYDWFVKWLGRAWHHFAAVAVPRLSDEERQRFEQIRERAIPLLERLDQATRDDLIPALKDGQAALVVEAKARSKQWHRELPSTRVALPMIEVATVCGVSDPAAFKRAATEYLAVLQAALDAAHELSEDKVPKIELPTPTHEKLDLGDLYSYVLPDSLGLDPQVSPSLGLSQDTLVLSAFPEQTKRLLQDVPVKRTGPFAATDRPLAAASYYHVPRFMDAISPWINYSVRIAGQVGGEDNPEARVGAQMVAGNVIPIIEFLKCCGEYMSVTYLEEGAIVTHSTTFFRE